MLKNRSKNHFLWVISLVSLISLVITPWWNVDSLVIPKMIILFVLVSFNLPYLASNLNVIFKSKVLLVTCITIILIIIQYFLITILSNAPLEQQIFGKTGRGLGLITELSLLALIIIVALVSNYNMINLVNYALIFSSTLSSTYAIFQYFNLDLFAWSTRTNGIIGTLGNPNFQSVIAALGILPTLISIIISKNNFKFLYLIFVGIQIFTVFICESVQGFILILISIFVIFVFYLKNNYRKLYFSVLSVGFMFFALFAFALINIGPFAKTFFDRSIQSRFEFWTTAINTTKSNPYFGVGIDSFGDVSSFYKNQSTARGVNEFTDSAHNYFLQYSATGGIPLALLYFTLLLIVLMSFFRFQRIENKFDIKLVSIFSIWVGLQAQSLINPGSIPLMTWNSLISGFLIGLTISEESKPLVNKRSSEPLIKLLSYSLMIVSLILIYPLFKSDKASLDSLKKGDANLAIMAAQMYPESTLRYSRIGIELLKSNLPNQALQIGRKAVAFNPNALSAWALILANPTATLEERKIAKEKILELDPFNEEIRRLKLP
jgi:O-antigen ligase